MTFETNNAGRPQWVRDNACPDSLKWSRYQGTDVLPMWVADMDVQCAEPILRALHERIDHGIFGYAVASKETTAAVIDWLKNRYGWHIQPEWIVWTPGLVPALNVICRAFATHDDQVLTFTPVYPPFLEAPRLSGRKLLTCPLKNLDGRYTIDFEKLQSCITDKTKVLLLCSPHNPVGRVWEKETLQQLAQLCLDRRIVLCSDEIHCDLVLDAALRHTPTASLSPEIAANTITLMSPAKTFNLPGLNCGFVIISDPGLRRTYKESAQAIVPHVNALGYTACRTAFTQGQDWLGHLLEDLRENHRILHEAINNIDGLSMAPAEATFLAWIHVEQLNLSDPAAFFRQAGIGIQDGTPFGQPGYIRLNFACCRENLLTAIERIKKAVDQIRP